jgi:hypothetical protein
MESILEHALDRQKHIVAETLQVDVMGFARNRAATYVVEKALRCCALPDQRDLIAALVAKPEDFADLAANQFGFHVAKAATRAAVHPAQKAIAILKDSKFCGELQANKYGKRVLEDLKEFRKIMPQGGGQQPQQRRATLRYTGEMSRSFGTSKSRRG